MDHPYIPNTREVRRQMLQGMGLSSADQLFSDIPDRVRLKRKLSLPPPAPEIEVMRHVREILSKNKPFTRLPSFLGGGVWPHHVPSHVKHITQRSEFLTSYTPYQPETSQGMLQALFEYQSLIAELVGLEVANASMYDWATSLGEAATMCARVTGRSKFIFPKIISQDRLAVLRNYAAGPSIDLIEVGNDPETGQLDLGQLSSEIDDDTSGVYIENPSYLGFLETQVDEVASAAHRRGALFVVGVNPISLGFLKAPGDYGADIVIGEGQPLGNAVSFGGPTLGIFACRGEQKMMRQIPGRLIGMTTTLDGMTRGFAMALQTREQHIRHEKATSNICSNETLCALAAAVYMATLGPKGFRELAETCAANASYLMKRLNKVEGLKAPIFKSPHFNEFTLQCAKGTIDKLNAELLQQGVHGGRPLRKEFPELGESALLCTTEIHTKKDLDALIGAAAAAMEGEK